MRNRPSRANKNGGKALSRSALRRQREREERYLTISRAAERLFTTNGYHQTSVDQIADLAEVSVGTVYFYFKNKEDLLVKLFNDSGYQLRTMLGEVFQNSDTPLEGIEKAGHAFFQEFCPKYPEKVAILYKESVGQSPLVDEHRRKVFDKITNDVRKALDNLVKAMDSGFPGEKTAEVIATSILGIYERVACQYIISEDRSNDLRAVGNDAVAFLIGGIKHLLKEN